MSITFVPAPQAALQRLGHWLLWVGLLLWGASAWAAPLDLLDTDESVDAWPAVAFLSDPGKALSIHDVVAEETRFVRPAGAHGTLGIRPEAVWLRLPLATSAHSDGRWILDIAYHPLNLIDVYLQDSSGLHPLGRLGSLTSRAQRPMKGLTHSLLLNLTPGETQTLYLRVETQGAMILPISLVKPETMVSRSGMEQMLQGLMTGLGLTLIAYSLIQWRSLREPMFIQYALMISGSLLFSLHFFGVGAAYLWPDVWWLENRATGISSLMATCGGFLFVSQILYGQERGGRLLKAMRLAALLTFLFGLAHVTGLLSTRAVAAFVSLVGPLPMLLGLPGAWRLLRQRDPIGATLLVAWVVHFAATATIIGVIQGRVPIGFWTLHSFQLGATVEMLLFMYVLGLRSRELRITAQTVTRERDAMRSLAHTDPLTGVPNRRGLQTALVAALEERPENRLVALFLLDLDGFKPVNDTHGHEMGDELLVAVTRRLQGHVRQSDLVARLGGDEFVVVARHLSSARQAHELGLKLLHAFESPFALPQGHSVKVGLTIGYALAPEDSTDPMELIRLADAAMYDGKQAGKSCVQRHSGQRVLV